MQFRSDSLDGSKLAWERTPHGYVAFATLAKIGHPLTYVEGTQTREEYLANFSEDSISSIRGMPICLSHPESVTYQGNKSGAGIGHFLQELLVTDEGELLAPVSITDKRGIDLIDKCLANGQNPEISPAYWVEKVKSDGKGGFEQVRGRYDHAALLLPGQGRGGESIALRLDAQTGGQTMSNALNSTESSTNTNAETAVAVSTVPVSSRIAELERQIDNLTGENVGLRTQLETLSKSHLSLDSVNNKLKTLARIGNLNLDSIDITVPESEIQKQHILKIDPSLELTGKSDDYIAGVFESLVRKPVSKSAEDDTTINSDEKDIAVSSAAIATAQDQLSQLSQPRLDSSLGSDPIAVARKKRLAQIENQNKTAV